MKFNFCHKIGLVICIAILSNIETGLLACSEAGPKDFQVDEEVLNGCFDQSQKIVDGLSRNLWKISGRKDIEAKPPYKKFSKSIAAAEKSSGEITVNVNFLTASGWDCVYCVRFATDGKSACSFKGVVKHFCSQ